MADFNPPSASPANRHSSGGWAWVPTLYFAQGIPYVAVMFLSVVLYKRLGLSNADIALYTSWLYLPWVVKPLWSPVVELIRTKRWWVVATQLVIGAGLAGVGLTIPASGFVQWTLIFFWLLAFSSATHDIAADGFYMLGLNAHDQAWFVGVRSTFYRMAMIAGQGAIVMLAGLLETATGLPAAQIEVRASPQFAASAPWSPLELAQTGGGGESRLVLSPGTLELATSGMAKADVEELVARARAWNQTNGFTVSHAAPAAAAAAEPSWWRNTVSDPLGGWLRKHFGPTRTAPAAGGKSGAVGVVFVGLSQPLPPGASEVVANLSLGSGDKSLRLVEGERLIFNPANASRAAAVVAQLDPKVSGATSARFKITSGRIPLAWSLTFLAMAGVFLCFCLWHAWKLPRPAGDQTAAAQGFGGVLSAFFETFRSFFAKPMACRAVAFILLYRFAEAQLIKVASLFLLDAREAGGLGLSTGQVGFVYGTVGVISLTLGGILGGFAAARHGLRFWLPWMVLAINLPNVVYVYLTQAQPTSLLVVNACVAVEQFGYGFGFTAFMLYLIYFSRGPRSTAHYAICTGFMALGMMLPGMFSGWLQSLVGYPNFFIWVMVATLPGFAVAALVRVEADFGRKEPGGGPA